MTLAKLMSSGMKPGHCRIFAAFLGNFAQNEDDSTHPRGHVDGGLH